MGGQLPPFARPRGDANERRSSTSCFDGLVVGLADELLVVHQVELVAGVELAAAHGAREALEVVDVVLRSTHDLCRRNALLAARTLRPVPTTTDRHTSTVYTATRPVAE